jgi:hypothetical protein
VRRSLSALACLLSVFVLGSLGIPSAGANGWVSEAHSNSVQASNSNSASPVVRTGSAVPFDAKGTPVTDTNFAYAHSFNCTGCRTVAVAVQVVVVEGTPTNYQPQNAAVAVNENCQSCQTFAYAHQYVIQTTTGTHFDAGEAELSGIQWRISQVAHSSEDFATMSSQLDQLSLQFYNAVYQSLQNQNRGDGGGRSEHRQVQAKN